MQRARLDQREVGDERAELRDVLDPADQVAVGRVVFADDRRPACCRGHQHVHLVAIECLVAGEGYPRQCDGFLLLAEIVAVLDHILLHDAEIFQHFGQIGIFGAQLVHHVLDCRQRGFAVELLDPLAPFPLPLRDVAEDFFQSLLQSGDGGFEPASVLFLQFFVFVRRNHLMVAGRSERKSFLGAQQHDILLHSILGQFLERLLLALGELFLDCARFGAVFFALEQQRDRGAQIIDQLFHIRAQFRTLAAWQLKRLRLVRLGEVIEIAPIRRLAFVLCFLFEELPHHAALAYARGTEHKKIIAVMTDACTEVHRIHRAHLADDLGDIRQFCRGLEFELTRIADMMELLRLQRLMDSHFVF